VITVLRWLAVLPGAVLAAILVSFPVHWAVLATFTSQDSIIQTSGQGLVDIERLAQAFFGPLAGVWASGRIAPARRFETAVVVGVLVGAVVALAPSLSGGSVFVSAPNVVLNLLGIAAGAYLVRREVEHDALAPATSR
jgi:hypothetical protein